MAIARDTIDVLEQRLKIAPWTGDAQGEAALMNNFRHSPTARTDVCTWLGKKGIPFSAAKSALDTSLARAYIHKGYAIAWRNRVNPDFAILGGGDDDDDVINDSATKSADAPKAVVDEEFLRKLYAQIETTAGRLIDLKLSTLKINLDDGAKAQIRALAISSAEAVLAAGLPPREIVVTDVAHGASVNVGRQHVSFDTLLRAAQVRNHKGFRLNVWLTGPTGSGKTSAAEAVSRALASTFTSYRQAERSYQIVNEDGTQADLGGLDHDGPFGADSSLDADYKVIGFKDANGHFHWTTFLRIFVYGGIYVADEIDNWNPSALLALNSALANGWISTPIGMLRRHKDCCVIACANTWGLGATSGYVGRTRLDDATLDRFQPKISWPYDEKLERAIADDFGGDLGLKWHDWVVTARHKAQAQGLKIIISPRGTFDGIALLQSGFSFAETTEMTIASGLSPEQKKAVGLDQVPNTSYDNRSLTGTDRAFVEQLVRTGQMIEAIKTYRSIFNSDLLTAKKAVEAIRDNMVPFAESRDRAA